MNTGSSTRALPPWLAAFPSAQVRDLDPRRHALLEASAGTGKTFAIEHLVLRLLVENPAWNPEEVLLLSFTDKTVGELRDRIRTLLRAQVDNSSPKKRITGWSPQELERLRTLWLHADDLAVHTLHAFCQSAVQRDPLENSALIRTELTEDRALADVALDGLLRGAWTRDPVRFERLGSALGIGAGNEWRKKLITLALKWQPWRGDVFDPERDPDMVEALEAEAAEVVRTFPDIVAAVNEGGYSMKAHAASFAFTATGRPKKNPEAALDKDPWMKILRYAQGLPADPDDPAWNANEVLGFFRRKFKGNMRVITQGWESELPPGSQGRPEWVRFAVTCGSIRELWDRLEHARELRRLGLQAEAARELRAALDAEKLRLGRISYDDMPRRLVEALRRNPALAPRLRARYKVCIVDEFQDTDPIQWEILQHLCLDDRGRDAHRLPLVLVGDPKQAIYAFRGGDLRTYLRARDTFLRLAQSGQAQGIGLNANYRSRPALIETLNTLFAHADWFGPPPETAQDASWQLPGKTDGIAFVPVEAGLKEIGSAEAALVVRDFSAGSGEDNGTSAAPPAGIRTLRRDVRRWIVARIVDALREPREGNPDAPPRARPGDFAVLTRSGSEGESIARLLRQRGIPCRIRRKGGVFHGPAADALRLLIEWIGDAGDPDAQARILLLPFARRDAADMPAGRPVACPPLIARWAALAHAGRWPEFLDAVAYEGGYRDRLAAASPADAARFDRLLHLLAEAGSVPGTPARTLCERFDALRRGGENTDGDDADDATGNGSEDGNGIGEDAPGFVTVMTMHLSKGLEFRHVFVAATGAGKSDNHLVLRDETRSGFRIALDTKHPVDKLQAEQEARAENLRLYYVAFTRAKETLHIPLLPEKAGKTGTGPLGGFVANAVRALAASPDAASRLRRDEEGIHEDGLVAAERTPAQASTHAQGAAVADERGRENLVTQAREAFARRRRLTSYSRLALHATTETAAVLAADPLLGEDGTRAQRQEHVAEDVSETPGVTEVPEAASTAAGYAAMEHRRGGITAAELPPGAAAGTALHALLERTPFHSVLEAESPAAWLDLPGHRARVEETLRREGVDIACAPAAARAVWNALRCPLPVPEREGAAGVAASTFRLADLAPENLRHEVEFLLPFDGATEHGDLPAGVAACGTFLWGFIDLVYRHGDRYYLLDWKSNLLAEYDTASVRHAMDQHRYDLQWKLYSIALDRWLAARIPGYDPERHFGGVHYLFLRGATPDRFTGIAERPTVTQLRRDFADEIGTLLRAPRPREIA